MKRKLPHMTARALTQRFETQIRIAGELASHLRPLREANALYDELQHKERSLRHEKELLDLKYELIERWSIQAAKAAGDLKALSNVAATVCELHGPSQVRAHLDVDRADVAANAEHLADAVRHVAHAGPGLARWLTELRAVYLKLESMLTNALAEYEPQARAFSSSLLSSAATITEARAFLVRRGVRFPIPVRRRKPAMVHALPEGPPPPLARPSLPAACPVRTTA